MKRNILYNIDNTNIDNTNIDNTNIDNTNIDNTNIDNTNIDNTNIDNTNIDNTNIDNTNIDMKFQECKIYYRLLFKYKKYVTIIDQYSLLELYSHRSSIFPNSNITIPQLLSQIAFKYQHYNFISSRSFPLFISFISFSAILKGIFYIELIISLYNLLNFRPFVRPVGFSR